MVLFYQALFPTLWLIWGAYWWAQSRGAKATARQESLFSRVSYMAPLLVAFALLWFPRLPIPVLRERFLPLVEWPLWAGAGATLTATGLSLAIWARAHLGRNWSATITIKEDHELTTDGPYRAVRHPIYTGLLLAFVGQAIARGELQEAVAVALALWSFWRKLRIEEQWMREQFGVGYQAYARQVSALIPFIL
ncbi:MAG TPA: isoprenylcysteine carboxylmethyltransferase family protein [Steroidobacteraceae bacterium]|jgi:protein-S-isoprenylcysteine O-methyltransferase Ste14